MKLQENSGKHMGKKALLIIIGLSRSINMPRSHFRNGTFTHSLEERICWCHRTPDNQAMTYGLVVKTCKERSTDNATHLPVGGNERNQEN
jgi:hypothetical protein